MIKEAKNNFAFNEFLISELKSWKIIPFIKYKRLSSISWEINDKI